MITVPEAVEEIIQNTPFLEEGLLQGIINLTSLARVIQPQIQKNLLKPIKVGAIVMALKRISPVIRARSANLSPVLTNITDLTVRSNLICYTFGNSKTLLENQEKLVRGNIDNLFLTFSQGVFETTIFASSNLEKDIMENFVGEHLKYSANNLSSITIILPEESVNVSGVYYTLLKILAWEGINFVEVISSFTELTIFLQSNTVDRAFTALKKLNL